MTTERIIRGLQEIDSICGQSMDESSSWIGEVIHEAVRLLEQEPHEDTISRRAAIEAIENAMIFANWRDNKYDAFHKLEEDIKAIPSAESETAYWIRLNDYTDEKDEHKCSNCGFESMGATRFCPDCGRKMFEIGHWLFYGRLLKCSNCGYINDDILNECPNCGIMMQESKVEE